MPPSCIPVARSRCVAVLTATLPIMQDPRPLRCPPCLASNWCVGLGPAPLVLAVRDYDLYSKLSTPPHVTRAVKQRMKSVGNIAKITKAMKMVAASRLRGTQLLMEQSRGIAQPMVKLFGETPGPWPTPQPPAPCGPERRSVLAESLERARLGVNRTCWSGPG